MNIEEALVLSIAFDSAVAELIDTSIDYSIKVSNVLQIMRLRI